MMWLANLFVIGTTMVLLFLWFRYVCALLLAAQTSLDCSEAVARANSLMFASVLRDLESNPNLTPAQMDALAAVLKRDFEVVCYLWRNLGQSRRTAPSGETWMLSFVYRARMLRYKVVRKVLHKSARRQLSQMALIVSHFADLIGERGLSARA
jgi:hypothetical protein